MDARLQTAAPPAQRGRGGFRARTCLGRLLNPVTQRSGLLSLSALSALSTWTSGHTFLNVLFAKIFNSVAGVRWRLGHPRHQQTPAAPTEPTLGVHRGGSRGSQGQLSPGEEQEVLHSGQVSICGRLPVP